jgi:hypothetical protein
MQSESFSVLKLSLIPVKMSETGKINNPPPHINLVTGGRKRPLYPHSLKMSSTPVVLSDPT